MSVFAIIGGLFAAGLVIEAIRQYLKAPGKSPLTAFYKSPTVALARVLQILSAISIALINVADSLAAPITDSSTSEAVKGVIGQYKPEATTVAVLVIALAVAFEGSRYWGQHLWGRGYWVWTSVNVTDKVWK
jgi:hypothetical protein